MDSIYLFFMQQENGEEKCVIETRMRGRPGECESSCTQTCTVTPMSKSDTCGHGVEGPGGTANL